MSFTLKSPVHAELEIKKSRFLAWVEPLTDKSAVQARLAELRSHYSDARHICFAFYVAGDSDMSDDGEPSGTAGKPIFNVIGHKQLVNVLAVVVRYFGGVKLGAGGLARAYGGAVSLALEQAEWVPVETWHEWVFECPFSLESELRRLLEQHQLAPGRVEYTTCVHLEARVPDRLLDRVRQDFTALAPHRSDLLDYRLVALPES